MRRLSGWLAATALAGAVSGCAAVVSSTDSAYPVYGNPVNPTPVAGYRVECETAPSVVHVITGGFYSGCRQVIAPQRETVVVRTRG